MSQKKQCEAPMRAPKALILIHSLFIKALLLEKGDGRKIEKERRNEMKMRCGQNGGEMRYRKQKKARQKSEKGERNEIDKKVTEGQIRIQERIEQRIEGQQGGIEETRGLDKGKEKRDRQEGQTREIDKRNKQEGLTRRIDKRD